jgi:RHS repeat-associated protein
VIKSWDPINGQLYYYQDKLGSTTHVANASGALLESYRYDLYGTPTYFDSLNNQLSTTHYSVNDLYAGERWIPELRVYDLRNRFMSPELGRFLQPDPIGFKGDGSNLYRYCHNDPEDRIDPTGLSDLNYVPDWDASAWNGATLRGAKDQIIVSAHGTTEYIVNSNVTRQAWGAYKLHGTPIPLSMRLPASQVVKDIQNLKGKYNSTIRVKLDICYAGDVEGAKRAGLPAQAQQVASGLRTNTVRANTGIVNAWDGVGKGSEIDFSADESANKTVAPPNADPRNLASSPGALGAGTGQSGPRTFDRFGSTTLEASRWEGSWGYGGWLAQERTSGH